MDPKAIKQMQLDYFQALVDYSVTKVAFWRKLPYMALMADGRGGYSDTYRDCYTRGIWAAVAKGPDYVAIDCTTGLPWDTYKNKHIDPQNYRYHFTKLKVEDLDAEAIYHELVKYTYKPIPTFVSKHPRDQEIWRNEIIKKYDLKEDYTG
jgi:hypothetical protein